MSAALRLKDWRRAALYGTETDRNIGQVRAA